MNPNIEAIVSEASKRTAKCDGEPIVSVWVEEDGRYEIRGKYTYGSEVVQSNHCITRTEMTHASEDHLERIGELMGTLALAYAQKKGWA